MSKNYMYIKSVNNDEQHYKFPGLWTPTILSPGRSDQIRSDQIRSDQTRPDQTRSDQIR